MSTIQERMDDSSPKPAKTEKEADSIREEIEERLREMMKDSG